MEYPLVSIIIPTYKDWSRLNLCLKAMENQSYPLEKFEVIVVNNAPGENPPSGFLFRNNWTLITEEKSGSYAARNKALKICKGKIVGFTDSDLSLIHI